MTEFVELVCSRLGISPGTLSGNFKDRKTTRLRQVVAALGIERWGQRAGSLGQALGKHPDVVSRWARSGAVRRSTDHEFARLLDELDAKLSEVCRGLTEIV